MVLLMAMAMTITTTIATMMALALAMAMAMALAIAMLIGTRMTLAFAGDPVGGTETAGPVQNARSDVADAIDQCIPSLSSQQ